MDQSKRSSVAPAEATNHEVEDFTAAEAAVKKAFNRGHKVGWFEVYCYGITTLLGFSFYGWAGGFEMGFGLYFFGVLWGTFSFWMFMCSLGEVISSTAYSGGAFGLTRVVMGFFPGYLVGTFEFFEYTVFAAGALVDCSTLVQELTGLPDDLHILITFLIAAAMVSVQCAGGLYFWRAVVGFAWFLLILFAVYILALIGFTNFQKHASLHVNPDHPVAVENWFQGSYAVFFQWLPYTTFSIAGVESTGLFADMVENPRREIPKAMSYVSLTLMIVICVVMWIAAASAPGIVALEGDYFLLFPLFEVLGPHSSLPVRLIMIVATFASALGFSTAAGKLVFQLADSRLLPPYCNDVVSSPHRPGDMRVAMIIAGLLAWLCTIVNWKQPNFHLTSIGYVFAFVCWTVDMLSFIKLRTTFAGVKREYTSPFGIIGATCSLVFFLFGFIGAVGYQDDFNGAIYAAYIAVILTVYYFVYATYHQKLSEAEEKSLLVLHAIVYNRRRRQRQQQAHAHGRRGRSAARGGEESGWCAQLMTHLPAWAEEWVNFHLASLLGVKPVSQPRTVHSKGRSTVSAATPRDAELASARISSIVPVELTSTDADGGGGATSSMVDEANRMDSGQDVAGDDPALNQLSDAEFQQQLEAIHGPLSEIKKSFLALRRSVDADAKAQRALQASFSAGNVPSDA